MCLGTLVTQRLCSEGTKRFIRDCFVLRGHTETYQRFTVLRGHWYIIALRECSGISAGIPFGQPQVVVDWERVIWRPSFLLSTPCTFHTPLCTSSCPILRACHPYPTFHQPWTTLLATLGNSALVQLGTVLIIGPLWYQVQTPQPPYHPSSVGLHNPHSLPRTLSSQVTLAKAAFLFIAVRPVAGSHTTHPIAHGW